MYYDPEDAESAKYSTVLENCQETECDFFDPSYNFHCGHGTSRPPTCRRMLKKKKEILEGVKKWRHSIQLIISAYQKKPDDETIERLCAHFYNLGYRIKKEVSDDKSI